MRFSCRLTFPRILVALAVLASVVTWLVGSELVAPAKSSIESPQQGLQAQSISFQSDSGAEIKGWFIRSKPSKGAVLLLHGIRANRVSMLDRARYLKSLGYSVLLIDLQAHGESGGKHITFGYLESLDAEAAIRFLRENAPNERIGAIGTSLGGAALLLAKYSQPIDAIILESVYSTIELAGENRIRRFLGPLSVFAKYPLLWQLSLRLGIKPSDLHPIDRIGDINCAVLVMSGTEDLSTKIEESKELCAHAKEPKECWWIPGAAHIDLYKYAEKQYEDKVRIFFEKYLSKAE